jgi:hypothetical protein
VNSQDLLHLDETREIVEAVRRIRDDRSLLDTARDSLGGPLDRLDLSSNARTVVTPLLTAAFTLALTGSMIIQGPKTYWS